MSNSGSKNILAYIEDRFRKMGYSDGRNFPGDLTYKDYSVGSLNLTKDGVINLSISVEKNSVEVRYRFLTRLDNPTRREVSKYSSRIFKESKGKLFLVHSGNEYWIESREVLKFSNLEDINNKKQSDVLTLLKTLGLIDEFGAM